MCHSYMDGLCCTWSNGCCGSFCIFNYLYLYWRNWFYYGYGATKDGKKANKGHLVLGNHIHHSWIPHHFTWFCSQALKCNNRVRMAFALVTIVIGNTLISDWQVLYYKENPCYLPSPGDNGTTDVVDGNNITSSFENINDHINSTFEWNIDNCEGKSTSNHECFWNPSSRVTGDHCHTCHNACLSKQAFLNFYQFNIGVLFLSVGATLAYVFNFALLSDIVPPENQGSITVLTVTSGAFARAVTPLWYVESYEQTGKHTFLPLSVTNATILLVLVALAVLYKDLAPRCSTEAKAATNATALECSIVDGQ
ncbi:hypothetical protein GBAR_LOCUS783 [Geodia barretti]|uniref:Uncharacterized protein n=1 Tax=Geodia barretti TaxID=519541 RepID=A0AA35QTL5_GEOBA|nr:hypothetical protein GBAR_LOCUS783 [Geodia barretti]